MHGSRRASHEPFGGKASPPVAMHMVPAAERLTKLEFQADTDWDTYPPSIYTCPRCGERVGVTLRDLDRHAFGDHTNLSGNHARSAAALAADAAHEYNSFLDFYCPGFYCPGCGTPVRIYYRSWWGGRWTYGHDLVFVVEGTFS